MEIIVKKPFLLWRDDWQLDHDCLDEQHMEMANILNQLHHFVVHENKKIHAGKEQICRQLSNLIDIARRHFKTEEALMRAHDYPRLGEHHREHVILLAELQEWTREIETGSKPFTLQTLTALKHWQIDHVLYSDRLFTEYLKEQS
jgi:hemerythrin-like metal-binding protein